jgi:hypothetical protein
VRNSFDLATYEPSGEAGWEEAYGRLVAVVEQHSKGELT